MRSKRAYAFLLFFSSVTQPAYFVVACKDFWRLPVKLEQKDITTEITARAAPATQKMHHGEKREVNSDS
jgi:hypothetical protein